MARNAASSSLISTNPNPRAWPVNRSRITVTVSTVTPCAAKKFWTSCSLAAYERFPTKSFFTQILLKQDGNGRQPSGGAGRAKLLAKPIIRPGTPISGSMPERSYGVKTKKGYIDGPGGIHLMEKRECRLISNLTRARRYERVV